MRAFGREGSLGSTMGKDTEEKWRNQILSGIAIWYDYNILWYFLRG